MKKYTYRRLSEPWPDRQVVIVPQWQTALTRALGTKSLASKSSKGHCLSDSTVDKKTKKQKPLSKSKYHVPFTYALLLCRQERQSLHSCLSMHIDLGQVLFFQAAIGNWGPVRISRDCTDTGFKLLFQLIFLVITV